MMKKLKYFTVPVKIILILAVVAFLGYYRSAIFQPHINHYVDSAHVFLEDKLDINIPVYVSEKSTNNIPAKQADKMINKNPLSVVQKEAKEPVESIGVMPKIVEKEILIILNNDVEKTTAKPLANIDAVETVQKKSDEAIDQEEASFETGLSETKDESISLDPKVMRRLTETVEIINRKVDMLFDVSDFNKENSTVSVKHKDIAIVKSEIQQQDNTKVSDKTIQQTLSDELTLSENFENKDKVGAVNKPIANARDILLQARQTFWNGRPLDSEKLYLDLVNIEGGNPDVYGELGNVYYSQGKWQQAGKAYYEAAIRLLELNQTHQVNYLLRVIQGLDAESAEKLKLKISG